MTQREKDVHIETVVAQYLDKNFYPHFDSKFKRITDRDKQISGIDVIACGKNIDEKAKVRGVLNRTINYISFEIARRIKPHKRHTVGWFTTAKSNTDNYLFISIFSDQNNEDAISIDNIDHLVCLSVRKKEVYNYIGLTPLDLVKKSVQLSKSVLPGKKANYKISKDNKPRLMLNDNCYIVMSLQIKNEVPFNLVIPRKVLKQLPGTVEYYCGSTGVKKLP